MKEEKGRAFFDDEPMEADRWKSYRAELFGFIVKRVHEESIAEDIVHNVLLKAYTQWSTLRDPRKIRAWLYQITRNAIVDHHRSAKPFGPSPAEIEADEELDQPEAEKELSRCLVPLMNALPTLYREPLVLVELQGLKQREVAKRLGLSLPGAKSRVQRARRRLAKALLDCCQVELDRRGGVLNYLPRKSCDGCS